MLFPFYVYMIKRKSWVIQNSCHFSYIFLGCPPEYYGNECKKACSGHCLNNTVCDHISGICTDGCQAGYVGRLCDDGKSISFYKLQSTKISCFISFYNHHFLLVCKEGYYGQDCLHACSSTCKTCKYTDGTCSCQAGWKGSNCTTGIYIYMEFEAKNYFYYKLYNNAIHIVL